MALITIALDAMGGDYGTRSVIPAAIEVINKHDNLKLILVGDSYIINKQLKRLNAFGHNRLVVHHTTQKIGMDESPLQAMRVKKDSSMRVALNLVRDGQAQACVSAGNTGALLAIAKYVLKTLPGIDRPAIIRILPTKHPIITTVRVLDLGANVDSEPENLLQFAIMGAAMAKSVDGIAHPKVALLNIGEEEIKGNELVKKTNELLKKQPYLNYKGYIEGDKIYSGKVDVIVCDGFIGNIALKVTEGTVKMFQTFLKESFKRNIVSKLVGLAAIHIMKSLRQKIDPEVYNGASLVGLNGIVIKSHGGARKAGFANAIEEGIKAVTNNVQEKIKQDVASILQG